MARATVVDQGLIYTVNADDPRVRGRVFQSLLIAQLTDEISDGPIDTVVKVFTDLETARIRMAANGVAGLVGVPLRVFPKLDSTAYDYRISLAATGYTTWSESIHVPAQVGFPATFHDKDLGQIAMRRTPFALNGRAVTLNASNQPVSCANAQVTLTGLWRQTADIDVAAGPPVVPVLGVRPSLSAMRPFGAGIEVVTVPTVVEPPRALIADAAPGSAVIVVDQSIGLAASNVVGIDVSDPDRVEYIEVKAVHAAGDPNSPATLDLQFATKRRHLPGASVQKTNPPAPGPPQATLDDYAMPGDVTLFVNTVAGLGASQLVRISGGAAVPEYAAGLLYRAVSDPSGYYRMPELHRVAAIRIEAKRALPAPAVDSGAVLFTPDYALYANGLDLILT